MEPLSLVKSEELGISALSLKVTTIYSVGISSFANAELAMLERCPLAQLTATTLDEKGLVAIKEKIASSPFHDRITCKLEDVSKPLPYPDACFDFVYARLVLHYLNKETMSTTLQELKRILAPQGKLYLVLPSVNDIVANQKEAVFDDVTGLTTFSLIDHVSGEKQERQRRFYTPELIEKTLSDAGFSLLWIEAFEEQLCKDFERTLRNDHATPLIAVLALK